MQAQWWFIVRPTVNALYSSGGHVQRLLPLFVMEGFRRDRFAKCLAGPGVYDHRRDRLTLINASVEPPYLHLCAARIQHG